MGKDIQKKTAYDIVKQTKKEISDKYLSKVVLPVSRNEIGSRLDDDTMAKLDAMRKGR